MSRAPADAWGVVPSYHDGLGELHEVSTGVERRLRAAMGAPEEPPPPVDSLVVVVEQGSQTELAAAGDLVLEDGTRLSLGGALPADLPLGYHTLRDDSGERLLIVSPGRCPSPGREPVWGWALQSYALRSPRSWGIGDFGDLTAWAHHARAQGAAFALLQPLGADVPGRPPQASPYSPSSRGFLNPLYLNVERIPGAEDVLARDESARRAAHELNRDRQIDRVAAWSLKSRVLEAVFGGLGHDPGFEAYRAEMGGALERFAIFNALAEAHEGRPWWQWAEEFRHPGSAAVERFAHEQARRVRYHAWLQWRLDQQLGEVAKTLPLMHDLPVGFAADGADAWIWQDLVASGTYVGAPPDDFNPRGQEWGLPPFVPHRLVEARLRPLIETLRVLFRHASSLRIDHVMGLFRQFWIPAGLSPADGAYVRYPDEALLAMLLVESTRAGVSLIGEDLGTVEDGVREQLADHGVLSTRLVWFEPAVPADYPRQALAAITTHDLPTLAGLWSGEEAATLTRLGLHGRERSLSGMRERVRTASGLDDDASVEELAVEVHGALADSPSLLITTMIEDAIGLQEPPNRPGTIDEWPNWSLALPYPVDELAKHPLLCRVVESLAPRRRAAG